MQPSDLDELRQGSDYLRIQFLHTELDLAFTFWKTAQLEERLHDESGVKQARDNVKNAIRTIERFLPGILDEAQRIEIERRLAELKTVAAPLLNP